MPEDEGDGQEDVEEAARHVDPEVAHRRRALSGKPPNEDDGGDDAHGGRHELLDHQSTYLTEVRHGGLAAVVLPVGVGEEGGGGVEAERRTYRPEVLRIERQRPLDSQDHVGEEERHA